MIRFYDTTDGRGNWVIIDRLTETVVDTAATGRKADAKVEALNADYLPTVVEQFNVLDRVEDQDRNGKRELRWVLVEETYTLDWDGSLTKTVMSFDSSPHGYRGQLRSHYSEGVA